MDVNNIIIRLEACNRALERAAWEIDRSSINDLGPNVIESTSSSTTCLIEIRKNDKLIEKYRSSR